MTNHKKTPIALIILDGWGHREATDHNAIAHAHTPHWDQLVAERPHTLISASGEDVGLPEGQMGNSEVGHMSLGAGRIVYQNISKVDHAIKNFKASARQGDVIEIGIKAVKFGKASVTLSCEVRNMMTRETIITISNIIMVNIGKDGKPLAHGKTEVEFVKDRL